MMQKYLFITLLLFLCGVAQGQVTGLWKGKLTQKGSGFESSYYFELDLQQKDSLVTGTTMVVTDFSQVKVRLVGVYDGHQLKFKETSIVQEDSSPEALTSAWCTLEVILDIVIQNEILYLRGKWNGKNTKEKMQCIPGEIYLEKKAERV